MYGCDCNTVYSIGDAELLRQIAERARKCPCKSRWSKPSTGDADMDKWVHRRMEDYEEAIKALTKRIEELEEENKSGFVRPIETPGFVDIMPKHVNGDVELPEPKRYLDCQDINTIEILESKKV